MKRSDKYKMHLLLDRQLSVECLNEKPTIPMYMLYWHKDNEKTSYCSPVCITDIAPPVTPEIDTGLPLDVLCALDEQYGQVLKDDLQACLDFIDYREKLEKIFKL
jgi:hypothetical protein